MNEFILYSILGILFLFFMTSSGAAMVYFTKKHISKDTNNITLGFAGGIMMAASVWSLIIPSIEKAEELGFISFLPAAIGFIFGFGFLLLINYVYKKLNSKKEAKSLLFLALTIHNIPEGLAVGLAFGIALQAMDYSLLITAIGLALGIGIQNFPEGASISLPLKEQGYTKTRAFLKGMISGSVEIFAGLLGVLVGSSLNIVMPWLLSFAAGAMIYVVIEELVPESQLYKKFHLGTVGFMIGFVLMMILDVALG